MPMLLATLARRDRASWSHLKESIEAFGSDAGRFDDVRIRELGGKPGWPCQILVGKRGRGSYRDLVDVGYGVSHVLPIVVEYLRRGQPGRMFLLQQPEVNLHPRAQAALGRVFCGGPQGGPYCGPHQPVIIETHSDHLVERIRMDVRDGMTKLKPEDISILYLRAQKLGGRHPLPGVGQ